VKFSISRLLTLLSLLSISLSAVAEPAQSSLQLCEEKTKAFLKTDYCMDPKIPKTFFTPEFAALWLKACNPPEGEAIYWGCDPILESQDADPQLLSLGPAETDGENIAVPVVYKHQGAPFYSKVFVFTQHKGRWVIADIITNGVINPSTGEVRTGESEFKSLQANLGN
jgi:hypothetical protein